MPPWDWKDYDDVKIELGMLKSNVKKCSPETAKQLLTVRDNIDYLFEHSDREEDDTERDRTLLKEVEDLSLEFAKSCSCKKL